MRRPRLPLLRKPAQASEPKGTEAAFWSSLHLHLTAEEEQALRADLEWRFLARRPADVAAKPGHRIVRTLHLAKYIDPETESFDIHEQWMEEQFRLASAIKGHFDDTDPQMAKRNLTKDIVNYEFTIPGHLTRGDRMCLEDIEGYLGDLEEAIFLGAFERQPRLPDTPNPS